MAENKGFKKEKMDVIVCLNCGEIDRVDGHVALTGKCWHCGNRKKGKEAKK